MRKSFLIKSVSVEFLVFLLLALLCFRATENYAVGAHSDAENPLIGKLIVIDPGHGGGSSGAVGPITGIMEKDVNLDVSLRLRDLLEEANATVNMTRTEDVDPPIRSELANNLGADIFVCIHCNAFEPWMNGTGTWYAYLDGTGPRVEASKILATFIQAELVSTLGTRDLGVTPGPWGMLYTTNMPAILTELAFISNAVEELLLADPAFRQMAAEALFRGIKTYFESHPKATISVPTENIPLNESFTVNATIYSPGTINVTEVNATLTAPQCVELVAGTWVQNVGEIPRGENRSVQWTLRATKGRSYNLTLTVASFNYPAFNVTAPPINVLPYAGVVSISHPATESIYEIKLEFNATFNEGNNLTIRFYSYSGSYQGESSVWNGTPAHLELFPQVPHPLNLSVEIATLVLTNESGNEIYTFTTFTMGRSHLTERLTKLDEDWPSASPAERTAMFREIVDIDAQWPYAPP